MLRLPPDADTPSGRPVPLCAPSISRTADELSLTAPTSAIPHDMNTTAEHKGEIRMHGWVPMQVQGTPRLALVGIIAELSRALATSGVSIFALSTFDTDYVLVKQAKLNAAVCALVREGHVVSVCQSARDMFQSSVLPPSVPAAVAKSPLPSRYIGLWRRQVEEDPIGTVSDCTTTVWWLQAGSYYADIRVPRNSRSTRGFEELSVDWRALAAQKSFAGKLDLHHDGSGLNDVACWYRRVDFCPATGGADIGRNTFGDDYTSLVEVGHPDNDYLEKWVQESKQGSGFAAFLLVSADRYGWLFVGRHWASLGRPEGNVVVAKKSRRALRRCSCSPMLCVAAAIT